MSDLLAGLTTSIKSTAKAISSNEYVRKVTESMNDAIMNYPKAIMEVREATNEDPWGPTGPQMKKIAEYTRSRYMEDFYNVYTPLFSRMLENNKDAWRRVYKSLVLLDYLLKNGSERFVQEAREKTYELRRLESYKYIDEKGRDQGINIRHRVKQILEMMNDDELLQAERKKANADDKSKYRGFDQYDMKMSSSSFKSSSSSSKFDDWNGGSSSSTTTKRYDDDGFKKKEVSNFSFGGNRSPSPELGFVDEKKKPEEDDGFGDFVSSRSSLPAATNKSTPNPPRGFFDDPVPAIPPPSATSNNYVAPPLSPVAKTGSSNVDLLFDVSSPTPAAAPQVASPQIDLFAQLNAPVLNSVPAPAVAPASGGLDLFDFGAPPVAQPAVVTSPMTTPATNGFNDFDFGASFGSAAPTSAPMQPMCAKPQQPPQHTANAGSGAPKVGNSFAGLDQFMSLSLGSTGSNAPKAKTLNQMKGN
ncbi:unnamed protein product [Caenorhabditis brenneri]